MITCTTFARSLQGDRLRLKGKGEIRKETDTTINAILPLVRGIFHIVAFGRSVSAREERVNRNFAKRKQNVSVETDL